MSFMTGQIGLDTNPTNWGQTLTTFQVENCAGEPVGDPVAAMQAIIMNKVIANICNVQELATAISGAQGSYNTPGRQVLEAGATVTLAANTYNSVAFKVISGSGTIAIDGGAAQTIEAGEADSWTASQKLNKPITISCTDGKIVITTLA